MGPSFMIVRYAKSVGYFVLLLLVHMAVLPPITITAEVFQIRGYYLGATPEQSGVTVDADPLLEEKYYEVEANGVRLFFIRVRERLRLYRIIREEKMKPGNVKPVLDRLKDKYGTPDKQLIKTSSVRAKNKRTYSTSVKNKAVWNINDSQDFITEIESERVVYELVDHNPEKVKVVNSETIGDDDYSIEGWDPDY